MASVLQPESLSAPGLGEVADINPRFDRSQVTDKDEPVSFLPMANVSEQLGIISEETYRPVKEVLKGFTPFKDRDVLVAKITPCFENGKIAHARTSQRFGFGSTEFHVIRPSPNVLNDRYLFHFLRQDRIRVDGERNMTGSAGQRRVPKRFLEELRIPLPPIPEQRRIAAILDKADALRQKRREAIAKLDQLLQSVFLEMFGDPVANPKTKVATLGELCVRVTDGTHQAPRWSESSVPFIFQSHIKPADHVLPDFLEAMLNSIAVRRQVDQRVTGVAQKTLILRKLKELKVLVPSSREQECFKSIATSMRSGKDNQARHMQSLERCFASLQQRSFTGQL